MGEKQPPSEYEKQYWRIYAALQELAGATDEDVEKDKLLATLLKSVSRAILTYRCTHQENVRAALKREVLQEIGVPVLRPVGGKK